MNEKWIVQRAERKDGRLWLYVDDAVGSLAHVSPKRHMLVDSDALAFAYILETDDHFLYVMVPKPWWPELKAALDAEEPVWLRCGEKTLELEQFHDELSYLLENIRGNANYGEALEQAVQDVFFEQ
ncbi:hypothetical protein ETC05_13065 [Geobacillus sp. BMUD]|uniref:UPF0738 family protein n=1 Tax=Geobacillus sp. BMUD TaxID=2508876 RepID=UPI001491DB2F|nr:hypothetical protein [Geobacillus sp. BMUD]NNU84720.1 hypothetical protein [Geobacillus sp. BMUD]